MSEQKTNHPSPDHGHRQKGHGQEPASHQPEQQAQKQPAAQPPKAASQGILTESGKQKILGVGALAIAIVLIVLVVFETIETRATKAAAKEAKQSSDAAESSGKKLKQAVEEVSKKLDGLEKETARLTNLPTQIDEMKAMPEVLSKAVESVGQADAKIEPYAATKKTLDEFATQIQAIDERIDSLSHRIDGLGSQIGQSDRSIREAIRFSLQSAERDHGQRFFIPLVIHQWTATTAGEAGGTVFVYKAKGLLDQISGSGQTGSMKLPEGVEIQELSDSLRDAVVSTTIEEGSVLVVHLWTRSPDTVAQLSKTAGVHLTACVVAR